MLKKNTQWILLALVAIAAAALFYFQFSGNKGNKAHTAAGARSPIDPDFAAYINSFTSGYIKSNSSVKIRLAVESSDGAALNEPLSTKYFSFEPSIKGRTVWRDGQTLEFLPDKPLQNGQVYKATFHLNKLMDVKDELEEFEFRFQIIEQSLQLVAGDLKSMHSNDFDYYSLSGNISTADVADNNNLERTLVVSLDERPVQVKWVHDGDGTKHQFLIDSIKRREGKDATLRLSCDGAPVQVKSTVTHEFQVPARGQFKLIRVKVIPENDPYVLLNFSNPLNADRSLEGLISIRNLREMKFIVSANQVLVYPGNVKTGTHILKVDAGVRDAKGQSLPQASEHSIVFSEADPAVRFAGQGNILPSTNGLYLPFETVNLKAVDVTIVKIYENNVLQFFQNNSFNGSYQLSQVGKKVLKKRIILGINNPADYSVWKRSALDLSELFKAERGAIYRVSLSFKKSYSTYACLGNSFDEKFEMEEVDEEGEVSYFNSYNDYDYYGDEYGEGFNWSERKDPCKSSYYLSSERTVTRNILASDIGLTLKKGNDGTVLVVANDLVSAQPLNDVEIEIYDYQKQLLHKGSTGSEGTWFMAVAGQPAFLVARKNKQVSYLRFDEGSTLSLSMYDVSGAAISKGVKGFIYGERGVWRPGDSLFLNFILEDKLSTIPANHPVTFSLYNPQGQLYKRISTSQQVNGFYNFTTVTDMSAPTGVWNAEVKVGPAKFSKLVRIETIMPNRLKINLDFGQDEIIEAAASASVRLHTEWLTGAVARELPVKMGVSLSAKTTTFAGYPNYIFDDRTVNFEAQQIVVYDGKVDQEGKASIPLNFDIKTTAPGMLKAAFQTNVFEPGGAFSVDRYSIPYSPFSRYVGMRVPEGEKNSGILFTGRDHKIEIATVDSKGKPVSVADMKFELYKLEWRWWWDQYEGELANYATDEYHRPVKVEHFSTHNGKATVTVNRPDEGWGRYLLRVVDVKGGHASSAIAYFDWANWMERNDGKQDSRILSNMLSFSTDKPGYTIGEEVKVMIPTPKSGRALITIENGSRVMEAHWLETEENNSVYKFKVTPQMAPNVYVHVSLLQPHARTNDLPVRLYGVAPVVVDDPGTRLQPQLLMPDVLEPEKNTTITVSEAKGKKMAFTLAVVDEGLLDITRFKTPDPHKHFYAREALGVKTWDLYDNVIGAFGAELERILSIGGDGSEINNDAAKANRFKPMVKFFGPYFLNEAEKKSITFKMPMYVGAVRTMLIAGDKGAYGFAEKSSKVKAPLMVLATLPRVLSVGEQVTLPVSVFGGEKNIGSAQVKVEVNGMLQVNGGNAKSLQVKKDEESLVAFELRVGQQTGIAKVLISASGGGHEARYEVELDVRNPNPFVTEGKDYVVEAGQTLEENYEPVGVAGTNSGMLELSTIPPVNLEERLRYLMGFPHGCIEQTSSKAFAQLNLPTLVDLTPEMKNNVETNVKAALLALRQFQLPSGAFSYWPGLSEHSDWGTTYAGHFFLEAEKKGFSLPANLKKNWISFQQQAAQNFDVSRQRLYSGDQLQAYRLYVLALANAPVMGAMNRLRESRELSNLAKWMLAAAYAQAGQLSEASKIIEGSSPAMPAYRTNDYTYGSTERDQSVVLKTLCLLKRKSEAFAQLKIVCNNLSSGRYMSTQSTAFALMAVSDFVAAYGSSSPLQAKCFVNGNEVSLSAANLNQVPVQYRGNTKGQFRIKNNGSGTLFVRYINKGKPPVGEEKAGNEVLKAEVFYSDVKGNKIDPAEIEQGTNLMVTVTVQNLGQRGAIKNIALSNYIPSGWEIHNARLDDNESALKSGSFTYQDIRDDRVFTYFDLHSSQTKMFRFMVNASYAGKYYLPGINVEAMYDNTVFARTKGQWIEVKKNSSQSMTKSE